MFKVFSFLLCLCMCCVAAADTWIDVPFVEQDKHGCGAAVISMILSYWELQGYSLPEVRNYDSIKQELYSEQDQGILASKMRAFFSDNGFHEFAWNASYAQLKEQLQKRRPVIVSLEHKSNLHYVVVAGYTTDEKQILLNDPAKRKLIKMDLSEFDNQWARVNRWMLLAVPAVTTTTP